MQIIACLPITPRQETLHSGEMEIASMGRTASHQTLASITLSIASLKIISYYFLCAIFCEHATTGYS